MDDIDAVIKAAHEVGRQAEESLLHTHDHADAMATIAVAAAFRAFAVLIEESHNG